MLSRLQPSRRFIQFCIAGVLGFLMDAGLTQWLVHRWGLDQLSARVPALVLAVLTTWLYNRYISFHGQRSTNRLAELGRYVLGNAVGLCVNYAAYALAIIAFAIAPNWTVLAVAAGSVAGMGVNYLLAQRFIFRGS